MMRSSILLVFILTIAVNSRAQKETQCCGSLNQKKGLEYIKCKRNKNATFAKQVLTYSPLSYISGPQMERGFPKDRFPKDHYILSADVVPQFIIGGRWMPFPILITPRYMVRIFDDNKAIGDSSLPVRTPSYMPGATIFFPLNSCETIDNTSYVRYLSLSAFHHSNGQDGNEFYNGQLNHTNGNFSTNFGEFAYNFRWRSIIRPVDFFKSGDTSDCVGTRFHEWYGKLGYERHFNTADSLKSSYGDRRWNLRMGWIIVKAYRDRVKKQPVGEAYRREAWRAVFNATYIAGKRDLGLGATDRRINADLNIYRRIPSSPNTSIFAGVGYYGSDPYNIYYDQSYFFFRVGLAAGFFFGPTFSE